VEPETTIFDRLRSVLSEAEQEEQQFADEVTEDDFAGRESYDAFAAWATATFASAKALRLTPESKALMRGVLRDAVDDPDDTRAVASLPFVQPLIELHLAEFALNRAESAVGRLLNMLDYLLALSLEPIAEGYFSSVAQLYLLGFNSEAVVMARSALHSALEVALTRAGSAQPEGVAEESRTVDLVRLAGQDGLALLTASGVRDAHSIRLAGNHAVHTQLGSQSLDALQAIRSLHRVLQQLFPDSQEA
jgi:hypothetical protein